LPYYLDALRHYRIRYLFGYTSSLYSLAWAVREHHVDDLQMAVVVTNAEPLHDYQRDLIESAFRCPVRQSYGMVELVAGASECPSGSLHLWPSMGHVEVLEQDRPVPPGVVGDLVCTSLLNSDMPLIRYRVGDRGALADPKDRCACGRNLPMLESVEGRIDDTLYTPDGRRLGRLCSVFKAPLPVREAQIIQERIDSIHVRFVADSGFEPMHAEKITRRLRERMGNVSVVLERVEKIPRSSRGKFQAVVCRLPREVQQQLAQGQPPAVASVTPPSASS
jgi:phenylacetate-CoA ligase